MQVCFCKAKQRVAKVVAVINTSHQAVFCFCAIGFAVGEACCRDDTVHTVKCDVAQANAKVSGRIAALRCGRTAQRKGARCAYFTAFGAKRKCVAFCVIGDLVL
ncbi:MAG: hypothetical protein ACI9ND_002169 [Yoonia sp.]|jgi:hypothetical protein